MDISSLHILPHQGYVLDYLLHLLVSMDSEVEEINFLSIVDVLP